MSNPFIGTAESQTDSPFSGPALSEEEFSEEQPADNIRGKRIEAGSGQQEEFWSALLKKDCHIIVEARAGTGKSSSCREGMYRLIDENPSLKGSIRYTVFNSQNAKEFRDNCPDGVDVGTVHHFGYLAMQKACGSKLEKLKSYLILDETPEGRKMPRYLRKSIAMLVGHAKNQAIEPDDADLNQKLEYLLLHYDVNAWGRRKWLIDWAGTVLRRAAEWTELIDFDDMLWMPLILDVPFSDTDILFCDEVQDWNPTQHQLLPLLCPNGRVVAVGDRFQAIYAFRGADAGSMDRLSTGLVADDVGCEHLPLTITWRCPLSHVVLAQQFVPDLQAAPNAKDGHVNYMNVEKAMDTCQPGDMVLCPTNAPLISEALKLIGSKRRAIVRGRAVGDSLLAIVRSVPAWKTVRELCSHVNNWAARELLRLSDQDGVEDLIESVQDRTAGLLAVLQGCDGPESIEKSINALFSDDASPEGTPGAVVFSTIHRAKGLEANTVRLIDAPTRKATRDWEVQQAKNLRYVALTRSRDTLTFVSLPKE